MEETDIKSTCFVQIECNIVSNVIAKKRERTKRATKVEETKTRENTGNFTVFVARFLVSSSLFLFWLECVCVCIWMCCYQNGIGTFFFFSNCMSYDVCCTNHHAMHAICLCTACVCVVDKIDWMYCIILTELYYVVDILCVCVLSSSQTAIGTKFIEWMVFVYTQSKTKLTRKKHTTKPDENTWMSYCDCMISVPSAKEA